ncbi:NAD(P)H-dependent oxidoreductase subunit E [Nocardioides sp. GXQ0305]|uniref:NAD(P)H-dependent oxidoreductase subunit E n=1 Tax=Nocardioides sp. GXQ0305 TaxID=3423912 RepID=UPI003D7DB4FC
MTTESVSAHTQRVRTITGQHLGERGPLMPVLHDLMEEFGHITRDDVAAVADVLNLSVAEVHGVVSFYHDFRTTPPPAHTIALCRAEACQAVGAERVFVEAVAAHEGSDVEVREVFCLGNCALGPSGMLDGQLHGRLDGERIAALTGEWR